MSKLNKRAVAMFSLCLILFIIIVPFSVFAINFVSISWTKPSNRELVISTHYINDQGQDVSGGGTIASTGTTSGTYNSIPYGPNDYFATYASSYSSFSGSYSYYRCKVNGLEGGTSSSNPTIVTLPLVLIVDTSSYSYQSQALRYFKVQVGYTLTFDSQGGTGISPVTGTDITLGENGSYYSQYIPVRYGYDFVGWSLTPNGNIVYNVSLTEDTDVYAIWQAKANNVQIVAYQQYDWITYYADQSHSIPLPSLYEGDTGTIDIYYSLNQPQGYYFQGLHVDFNGQDYANLYVEDLTQHFTLGIPDVSGGGILEIYPLFEQRYDFNVTYNPSGNGTSNTFDLFYETSYVGGSQVHIVGSYEYPTFFTNCRIVGNETSKIYPVSVHDEYNETLEQFDVEFNFTMPNESCTLQIYWSILGGYPPQPTVSFDESTGDIYFIGVDYDNMYSEADFSGASDLIPKDIIGFAEYFSSLNGLVIIVTIILIAGFSAFLLRNH